MEATIATDEAYMRRCLELAERSLGHNAPNPRVGALLRYKNRIIGEGYHRQYGAAHAEVNAVANVAASDRKLISHSTLYVSLEPCFHQGKTPPCVDLILRERIPRVVIAQLDPFPEVAGQSIKKLQAAGVELRLGVLKEAAAWTTRRFLTTVQQKRPHIILKYAQSADGFLSREGEQIWLTNAFSKRLVHQWRAEEAAIMVGRNTASIDNPALTNRFFGEKQPQRIVLAPEGGLSTDLQLFQGALPALLISQEPPQNGSPHELWTEEGLPHLLQQLWVKHRLQSLIVEGGAMLLQSFLDAQLWDEARVFISPKRLGQGLRAPAFPQGQIWKEQKLLDDCCYWIRPALS